MGNIVDHIENGGGGGASNTTSVSLASNTFTVGQWIHNNSGSYGLADADDVTTTEPLYGVVTTAGDPVFSVTTEGPATIPSHGFNIGQVLYLSAVAGNATETVPTSGIYKQLGFVIDANTIFVRIGDTIEIGGDSNYAFAHYKFTGDGSSVNFDLPHDVAGPAQIIVEINGKIQGPGTYSIVADGSGDPRRLQLSEAPDLDLDINVHYLGIVKPVAEITPTQSTDFVSSPISLTLFPDTGHSEVISHGLSQKPREVHFVVRCNSSEHGYSVGDEIPLDNVWINNITGDVDGAPAFYTAIGNSDIRITRVTENLTSFTICNTGGSFVSLTSASWDIIVYANEELGGTNGVISAVNTPATEFESSEVPLTLAGSTTDLSSIQDNSNFVFSHGLTSTPKDVKAVIKCITPDGDFAIGDEVDVSTLESTGNIFANVYANSTEVRVAFFRSVGANVTGINDAGAQSSTLNLQRWVVKVYANTELGGYKGDRGPAGTGKVAQVKTLELTEQAKWFNAGNIPKDNTIPQLSEFDPDVVATLNITKKNPDSKLLFEFMSGVCESTHAVFGLFYNNETEPRWLWTDANNIRAWNLKAELKSAPSGTYKLYFGRDRGYGQGFVMNGWNNGGGTPTTLWGGLATSQFSITEILP